MGSTLSARADTVTAVAEFDPQAMVQRFQERAEAVKKRGMPPVEGPERTRFIAQAQQDFADFAMIGDAEASLEDGILTLRVDLRPKG
jgi:hypothetical protein